ncbi:hydrogen voltage-gated channel 1 [Trichoderma arundinaceum]|uniref:Hydrogen voltage-gated channel 1 n=1 Tax=Trichoderma arundinaceum TaxID=490622 RepID=A0A395NTA1_TRIAR|nr:hydrogen voltage-gated channel 1 [Trichoderma arundinaceum]
MADRSSTPLLHSYHEDDGDDLLAWHRHSRESSSFSGYLRRCRRTSQRLLESRTKHFVIMGIVALDVAALLANVFIQLIACEMHENDEPWVENVTEGLEIAGLVFSSLFLLELFACLFAFGLRGLTESIGSLIVVLRLWRLAKISEEVVLGATERMEVLEQQLEDLEAENSRLRAQLGIESSNHSGIE